MKLLSIGDELKRNPYPGRGIIIGRSDNGQYAVTAYFIMGRSENSRNRIFVEEGEGIRTEAYDPAKLTDPSLIIYAPVRVYKEDLIVTNGDQTDTVLQGLKEGKSFAEALKSRTFEPDAPNYTPRISGILHLTDEGFSYEMSILKSDNGRARGTLRYHFSYERPMEGEGRFLHTYQGDGNPLPSFEGEPELVAMEGSIDVYTNLLWESLHPENKVSLFVRYIDLETKQVSTRIVNRHQ